ncbi:high mobility group box [Neoconidiobolus thromboides FSU 785]|nr:high mobility group box [Neoconidiobolus thromboides FSU 785]
MFFSQSERENVIKENPNISFGEIGKILGQKWKGMTPEDKKPFEDKAKEDKVRYEKEKKTYDSTTTA